jgi:hypothetical protein
MSQENANKNGETEGGDSGGGGGGGGGGDERMAPTNVNPFAALSSLPSNTTSGGMIGERDQTLAYFQELTHLDDIEQCQAILESTNWDLDQAVQSFYNNDIGMPHINDDDDEHTGLARVVEGMDVVGSSARLTRLPPSDLHQINAGILSQSIFSQLKMPPQPNQDLCDPFSVGGDAASMNEEIYGPNIASSAPKRLLNFHIEYQSIKFTLHLLDSERVIKLKELIKEKLSIPCEHQKLNGWRKKDVHITDNMALNELSLPLDTNLFVINTADSKVIASSKEASIGGGVAYASGGSNPSQSGDFEGNV